MRKALRPSVYCRQGKTLKALRPSSNRTPPVRQGTGGTEESPLHRSASSGRKASSGKSPDRSKTLSFSLPLPGGGSGSLQGAEPTVPGGPRESGSWPFPREPGQSETSRGRWDAFHSGVSRDHPPKLPPGCPANTQGLQGRIYNISIIYQRGGANL